MLDVYLLGTVMLVFGMGLYELFISNLDTVKSQSEDEAPYTSSLFGMFILNVRLNFIATEQISYISSYIIWLSCTSGQCWQIKEPNMYLSPTNSVWKFICKETLRLGPSYKLSSVIINFQFYFPFTGTTEVVGYNNCQWTQNKDWPCNCDAPSNRVVGEEYDSSYTISPGLALLFRLCTSFFWLPTFTF